MSSLGSGTSFLHYQLIEKIGQGGMGEVWRATDTTLGREVAVKALPDSVLQDPERLARFEREAKALAALNHPGVATIHGFHREGGRLFLVMELVPGEDLVQRIARGALPLEEARDIAVQIAEALEAAHDRGIVHRDLKPANVKLLPSGRIKVLDFGLAKAVLGEISSGSATALPTVTSAGPPTGMGVILGTAAYMSPEQAKGKPVDRRADLWSFGCLLFEMLAGRRPFDGETVSETLASVLKDAPEWGALPAGTPPAVRRVLARCLEKDPARRIRSAADAALDLQTPETAPPAQEASPRRSWLPWALAAGLALTLLAMLLRPSVPAPVSRSVELALPEGQILSDLAPPALSPDGTTIVLVSAGTSLPGSGKVRQEQAGSRLYLRSLGSFTAEPVPGSEGASFPFWSPDSRQVGYFAAGELRRLDVASKTSQVVCSCAAWGRGGSWGKDGTILFAPNSNAPLLAVAASGGEPRQVTTLEAAIPDVSHRFPILLPDGEHFLYTLWSNSPEALAQHGGIYLASLKGGPAKRLLSDPTQAVLAPGALLLRRGEQLVAVGFDPDGAVVKAEATTLSPSVRFSPSVGDLYASASSRGDLVFAEGEGATTTALELVWLDRSGSASQAMDRALQTSDLQLSPDGTRFVAAVSPRQTGSDDLWVGEFARGTVVRLTSGINDSFAPRWSPDGRFVAYSNRDTGNEDIYRIRGDGTGVPERIFDAKDLDTTVSEWTPDGRTLLFDAASKTVRRGQTQVWALDLATRQAKLLLDDARAPVREAALSPDGRWLAYVSEESGQEEVYVRSFPGLDRKWQISQQGGSAPHWSRDGREIVFVAADVRVFAAALAPQGDDLNPGVPRLLFTSPRALLAFAPSPDHARFLSAVLPAGRTEPPMRLLLGWKGL